MTLTIILLVAAFGIQGILYYFNQWYTSWAWCWTWIVLPFFFFWGLFAIYIGILFLCSGSFKNKTYTRPHKGAQWVVCQTAFILCIFFRMRIKVSGLGKLPGHKTRFMLVNNHLSIFDEFALIHILAKYDMLYVSKEENFNIPIAGPWLKKAGLLSIKQNEISSGVKVIKQASEIIQSGKYSICIAPEGTRNKTFPEPLLLPFKAGPFNMAKEAECPIVVVAIQNTNAVTRRFPLSRTNIYIDVVGVIEPDEVKSSTAAELAERSRNLILDRFEQKGARFYHLDPKAEKKEATVK